MIASRREFDSALGRFVAELDSAPVKRVPVTHFCATPKVLKAILTHGLRATALRRNLLDIALPERSATEREPGQFGQVSFTSRGIPHEGGGPFAFGSIGITVSDTWAQAHKVLPVLYVPLTGPRFDAFKSLAQWAYADLKERLRAREERYPGDAFFQFAEINPDSAKLLGGGAWAIISELHMGMEDQANAHEAEWRLVHTLPLRDFPSSEREQPKGGPVGWPTVQNFTRLQAGDVAQISCPEALRTDVAASIPEPFHDVPVVGY